MENPIINALERTPIIAATDRSGWQGAVLSDAIAVSTGKKELWNEI